MRDLIKKFIPPFLLDWYHLTLAFLGAFLYGFPSKRLKVIGVTGTNGKSTVVHLTTKILEEAGYRVASLSSIGFKISEKEWPNKLKMTMPGRFKIQKFLRQASSAGCKYVVLEVTSEGIKQYRHKFIDFDAAVFTNLSPEHIEAHGNFENYRAAKGKLFQTTKGTHVINIDDKNAQYFLQFPANKKYTYGLTQGDVNAKNTQLELKLIGDFNLYNALAAICVGLSQRINLEVCQKALEKVEGIPGRMEIVVKEPFKVLVDYAVTPDALEKLYQTVKKIFSPQRIIAVFGSCGGGRDKWRRPALGKIAARYCDKVIITNEDPYDEDPYQILSMIKSGIYKSQFPTSNFYEILDRREAIRKSLELAKTGDIVVITGKGCEPWICVKGGKKIPWDDREVAREEFKKLS
ncbi:MAG TPA: UDP-N-acetylmuramoyl-L-alanyl-D-glutamate--2,6-diaminopimelate ligase [Candidatus Humimicrobiaceae bacterium]|nr:UDP-N-acetylmuramoyl-L-alanyl-D-glutamate--2,6-diaminopimelate ligase [Candidatus Humimicrobiaceae bacterium]